MGGQEVWSVSRICQRIGEVRWTTEHTGGGRPLAFQGSEVALEATCPILARITQRKTSRNRSCH